MENKIFFGFDLELLRICLVKFENCVHTVQAWVLHAFASTRREEVIQRFQLTDPVILQCESSKTFPSRRIRIAFENPISNFSEG